MKNIGILLLISSSLILFVYSKAHTPGIEHTHIEKAKAFK